MAYPPVIIVDEHDQEIGHAMLSEVWERGHRHRIVRVMVEDSEGNILLQKRHPTMLLFPGRWDNSAAGHVDEGMTYHSAAIQEVREELGIEDPELEEIGHFFTEDTYEDRKMNIFHKVYRLRLSGQTIIFGPDEVTEVKWLHPDDVKQIAQDHPHKVTYGLVHVMSRYY